MLTKMYYSIPKNHVIKCNLRDTYFKFYNKDQKDINNWLIQVAKCFVMVMGKELSLAQTLLHYLTVS